MGRPSPVLVCALAALSFSACAPATHYAWGGYDQALYGFYKNPQDRAPFIEQLRVIIASAEQSGQRVPPGLFAEYGYLLFEEGKTPEAILYFQKERQAWPEAVPFMDKMIRNAGQRLPKAAAAGVELKGAQ